MYQNLHDRLFGAAGQWCLSQCPNAQCGLIWMNPMPLDEDLHLAYETYFTHESSQESTARKICLAMYHAFNSIAGIFTGLTQYKQKMQCLYLENVSPGSLLDVGCGDGRFLNEMKPRGWQVQGVEIDPQAVKIAREKYKLEVHLGDLKQANFSNDSFDAITLRHVVEHLPHPVDTLRECRRILKPGGHLVVVTPNTKSWGHSLFKQHWLGLDQPRHLMIFSPASMALCAKQAGFEKIQIVTSPANAETVFSVSFSLLLRHTHDMDLGRPPEISRAIKAVFYQHWESLKLRKNPKIGEELVMLATKY
ncbi:MAG: class I SAM-dependent methyltransferase [Verrucomicrobiae bacterium]|nr:class I SAM-dependent methyltransferase [Verrucomicrobiae bacterium]